MYLFLLESLESWNNAKWEIVYEQYLHYMNDLVEDVDKRKEILENAIKLCHSLSELSQAITSR